MRIIRFVKINKVHIIDPTDTIEEVVDKWKCNGNPDIIVDCYADSDSPSADPSSAGHTPSTPLVINTESESKGPSGIFWKEGMK